MTTFNSLLVRAFHRCNRCGAAVAVGVAVAGVAILVVQLVAFQYVGAELTVQLRWLLGEQRFQELQQDVGASSLSAQTMQATVETVLNEVESKVLSLSEPERGEAVQRLVMGSVTRLAPVLAVVGLLAAAITLLGRAYFLTLMSRRIQDAGTAVREMLRMFAPLLGCWIVIFFASFLWLPIVASILALLSPWLSILPLVSFIVPAVLFPRFLFAPVILLQEKAGVLESVRQSYRRTRGMWWKIVTWYVGAGAVVWIAMTFINLLLNVLVTAVMMHSVFGAVLYWLTPFFGLIGLAYRFSCIAEMKEELLSHP